MEGFLPHDEFLAWMEMGFARVLVMAKQWTEAEAHYQRVLDSNDRGAFSPEATYWRGVCQYQSSHDHTILGQLRADMESRYPGSRWALATEAWPLPTGGDKASLL